MFVEKVSLPTPRSLTASPLSLFLRENPPQGVGSHAAHFLLRSGIGKLRLVDFDQVTLSSLNRHALATRSDVGIPKATCLKNRFAEICPECEVAAMVSLFDDDTSEAVLEGRPDFVIDAIDNIHTKVQLLMDCKDRGIEVLCVCGAGHAACRKWLTKFTVAVVSGRRPLMKELRDGPHTACCT